MLRSPLVCNHLEPNALLWWLAVVVRTRCIRFFPYATAMHARNSGDRTPGSQTPGVPATSSPRQPTTVGRRGLPKNPLPPQNSVVGSNSREIHTYPLEAGTNCDQQPEYQRTPSTTKLTVVHDGTDHLQNTPIDATTK